MQSMFGAVSTSRKYWSWVSLQLAGIGASAETQKTVVMLLKALQDNTNSDEEAIATMDLVTELANSRALFAERNESEQKWVQVLPGEYAIGDTVRVRQDAYSAAVGHLHNGKRGRVAGVRGAKAIVIYDDARDSEDQHYHDPSVLERLA